MNIRRLTTEERERLAYIEDHPDKELLGELADSEHRLDQVEWRLEELED